MRGLDRKQLAGFKRPQVKRDNFNRYTTTETRPDIEGNLTAAALLAAIIV